MNSEFSSPGIDFWYDMTYAYKIPTKSKEISMKSLPVSKARQNLYRLVDETAENHEPVIIAGKRHNAVLLSEEDWRAVQETLYLVSIPGMRESIRDGLAAPLETCEEEPEW
jgi:antitoxin YefM